MTSPQVRTIAILGRGIVGWSAAAALRKNLPQVEVAVVGDVPGAAAHAESSHCSLPSILEFLGDLGIDGARAILGTRAGIRLGTQFVDWSGDGQDYVHAYGSYGGPIGAAAFHQSWLKEQLDGDPSSFESYSVAAAMARAGKFSLTANGEPPFGQRFAFGLHIDPQACRATIRDCALQLGAREEAGSLDEVRMESEGRVAALRLADGRDIASDLFVDAGGPQSLLRRALGGTWEDWSSVLPCDRLLTGSRPAGEAQTLDRVEAVDSGWAWDSSEPWRTSAGLCYCSADQSEESAAALFARRNPATKADPVVELRQGRWSEPWSGNCVAIGDAAVSIEPLEWTNLHLALNAIDRLVALLPDREFSPVELWDYNRQASAEADRVRDFVAMHYAVSARSGKFWTRVRAAELPESLAHTLLQFRERGRLPFYEEETFSRDSWLAVLFGQGIRPRRIDPLADSLAPAERHRLLAQMRSSIAAFVEAMPPYSLLVEALRQKVA